MLEEIRSKTDNKNLDLLLADLSSQADIRKLAEEFKRKYQRLDVLVNNAGGIFNTRKTTVDGLEYTFAFNHLAYFLLTNLLLDVLKASTPARIVNVSSGAQGMGRINFDDLQGAKRYNAQAAYNQSKLANVIFTYQLARRLEGTGVTANVLHPGVVRTNFGRSDPPLFWRIFFPSPEVAGVSGKYFAFKKAIRSNPLSYDPSGGSARNSAGWSGAGHPAFGVVRDTLPRLTGQPTRNLEQFARDYASALSNPPRWG